MLRTFRSRCRWSPIVLAIASQVACGRLHATAQKKPPPAIETPKSPPPGSLPSAIVFDAANSADLPFGKCFTLAKGLQLEVTCRVREGDGYSFTLDVPGSEPSKKAQTDPLSQSRNVSLLPAFGRAPSHKYNPRGTDPDLELDPATEVTMVFQDGSRLSGKLPATKLTMIDYLTLAEQFPALAKTGFQFSKDEPAVTHHSVLHISEHDVDVIGPAAHYNETDWTAVEEGVKRETTKVCKGYEVEGETKDLPLSAEDVTVTVRNRTTGEVVQTKTFPSDMVCPAMAVGQLVAGPDDAAIATWLTSLIAKKK